jgi:5-hydroxyisourate hydrolase-like protein (transthyretin family)
VALVRMACIALFTIGVFGAGQQSVSTPALSPQQTYSIAGMVVNSVTGQPVAAASVAIGPTANQNGDVSKAVTTGADGRFALTGLARGKYSLMATAHGFGLQAFDHHDGYATAIAVGPDLDSEHLVFRLEPDSSIEGQVIDENNDPVQHAMVRLFEKRIEDGQRKTSPVSQAQTDDQGHFRIGHLAQGTYYLAVAARPWYAQNHRPAWRKGPGNSDNEARAAQEAAALDVTYPFTFYPSSTDSAGASPILLHPGESASADVVMHTVPALHLRIRTGGSPTGNTGSSTLFAMGRSTFPRVYQRLFEGYLDPAFNAPVSRAEPGVIEIMGLAAGHYVVEMPASGAGNEASDSRGWYEEIDLAGDAELNPGNAPAFASVSGFVSFPGEASVPKGAAVRISDPMTGTSFASAISDKGQVDFSADAVRAGRYNLSLGSSQGFFLGKLSATGARLNGRTLEIGGGSSVHFVGVAARGVGQVDGVALRDGRPFAGAMIVLVPRDPEHNSPLFRRDQSDSDGTFTLPNVVPGQYTVVAIANGWDLEWGNSAVLNPYLEGGEMVQAPSGGKLQIKVQVQ